jgi:hypothetical protein
MEECEVCGHPQMSHRNAEGRHLCMNVECECWGFKRKTSDG